MSRPTYRHMPCKDCRFPPCRSWAITQRVMVILYRRLGTTLRAPSSQGQQFKGFLIFEDRTARLPRNVSKEFPLHVTQGIGRARLSVHALYILTAISHTASHSFFFSKLCLHVTYTKNHNYGTENVQAKPKVLHTHTHTHTHMDVSYLYKGEGNIFKKSNLLILTEFKLHVSAHLYSSRHQTVRHKGEIVQGC